MEQLNVTLSPKEHKRIFSKIIIDPKTKCWNWNSSLDQMGYGLVWYKNRTERIHRIIYAFFIKPIPKTRKVTIDHLCRNHACCNPEHLELVPHIINVLRGIGPSAINAKKIYCKNGHKLPPYNVNHKSKRARAFCKICDSIRHKKRMNGPKRKYWLEKAREAAARYRLKHHFH